LTWAADHDERITRRPWKTALKALGGEEAARNVVLGDEDLRLARGQAYKDSEAFGLLFDVHYETGARSSQIVRLQAEDVQADFIDPHTGKRQPRLMMPTSKKGGSTKARTHTPVPITADLAQRLRGRTGVLLTTADGTPWSAVKLSRYFANAVEGVRFANPAKVTLYALRHGSITRQLLAGVPIRVVAAVHDTSVQMIERSYSAFIGDHSDDMVRKSLPQPAEVVPLGRHRA
jgi:integrase